MHGETPRYNMDDELARREDLKKIPEALLQKFENKADILYRAERGEWLDQDELIALDLEPKTIQEYMKLREVIEKESELTDEERATQLIRQSNKEVEKNIKFDKKVESEAKVIKEFNVILEIMKDHFEELSKVGGEDSHAWWFFLKDIETPGEINSIIYKSYKWENRTPTQVIDYIRNQVLFSSEKLTAVQLRKELPYLQASIEKSYKDTMDQIKSQQEYEKRDNEKKQIRKRGASA